MSDRLLLDTNVLLDHLLDRQPYADAALPLWSLAERKQVTGLVAATSCQLVYHIIRHITNTKTANQAVAGLRDLFDIVEVDDRIITQAVNASFSDFEDAIQHTCALRCSATHLITRELHGFRKATIHVLSPAAYLHLLSQKNNGAQPMPNGKRTSPRP